jgi:hypothetical protein
MNNLAMLFFNRQFLSWLLVLIMMISPIQVVMASDFAQDGHGAKCQMSGSSAELVVSANCGSDHDMADHSKNCQEHPGCIAHSSTTLFSSSFVVALSRAVSQLKFKADHDTFLTHYPSLLKRPPKSS